MDIQTQKDIVNLYTKSSVVQTLRQLLDCERIIFSLLKDDILDLDVWKEEMHPPVNKAPKIALNILDQLRELMYALDDICTKSSKKNNKQ